MSFGKVIPGLKIDSERAEYPVFNERKVRASAGLMMLIGLIVFFVVFTTHNYSYLIVTVFVFWLEFLIRTMWGIDYSPFGYVGGLLVRNQRPEWVGAIQKRFAWGIGLIMASAMIVISVFLQIRGIAPITICMTCLFLMWMESVLGICIGCKMYYALIKAKILKEPEIRPACPGGVCSIRK